MMAGRTGRLSVAGIRRRFTRIDAGILALLLAALAATGWFVTPFGVAIVIGAQLVVGGVGGVWLVGPIRPRFGLARYGIPALAAVSATLVGRLLTGPLQLVAVPVVAAVLMAVIWAEVELPSGRVPRLAIDLSLVGVVFAVAAGVAVAMPRLSWPPALLLVLLAATVPALRAAELRGRFGVSAVGDAALHLLALAQLGVALALLDLPGVVSPALLALGFHAWGGAAESLEAGAPRRAIVAEFGTLAALGIAIALILTGR